MSFASEKWKIEWHRERVVRGHRVTHKLQALLHKAQSNLRCRVRQPPRWMAICDQQPEKENIDGTA